MELKVENMKDGTFRMKKFGMEKSRMINLQEKKPYLKMENFRSINIIIMQKYLI